ncbi:hypothetical protein [Halarcobacter anaerophilus]|uniref:hypothetical protein n=1 Tax=Halarcobacter anaerophilus TaxID=877500 RepID=UPI000697E84A|nr:hypothetical protein [Halarcobacter anaerophilus]
MKIFNICLLLLIGSSILHAVTPEEFEKIASQYKMIDNSKEDIPTISFRTRDGNFSIAIEKQIFDARLTVTPPIIKFNDKTIFHEDDSTSGISDYDIQHFAIICYNKNDQIFATSVVKSSYLIKKQRSILYENLVYHINDKTPGYGQAHFINHELFTKLFNSSTQRTDIPYDPKNFNPYYNEEKILERLYETGTCNREATKEANIQVLVNGKWLPQEETWNIKKEIFDSKAKSILPPQKQPLYKTPPIKTKMYLIKGDKVEILEEKDDWLHILYHGKKDIKAWIPKSAVE